MMKPMLISAILWLAAVYGYSSTDWPNEPAGSTLLSDFGFDSRCGQGWVCTYPTGAKIVQDPTARFSGPNVMQYTWQNHNFADVSNTYYPFPNGTREFYIGFWWKPSNPFYGWANNDAQKIILIEPDHTYIVMKSPRGCLGGCDPYYITGLSMDNRNDNRHVAVNSWGEPVCCNNNMNGNSTVTLGQWHRIEIHSRASTTPTSRDGIQQLWLDGQLLVNYTNVNFVSSTFNTFMFTSVWDAPVPEYSSYSDSHEYDHVHLSIPNCGANCPVQIPLAIGSIRLNTTAGTLYTDSLTATGGKAPYFWSIPTGNLPAGLSLKGNVISGTPTTLGASTFTARFTDATGATTTKSFTIIVSKPAGIAARQSMVDGSQLPVRPGMGNVLFQMPQGGAYSLSVYDLSGREVWRHVGVGEAIWNHGGKLKKGVYLVRAEQNGKAMTTNYCQVW